MKRVVLSISIVLLCIYSYAQVPESFNYQAVPRNEGKIYPEVTMKVQISILSGSPTGSSVYTETFNATTTIYGLLSLQIGKGTATYGSFTTIDWGTSSYFIKVEIDFNGGTSYTDMGTTQLLSVPYALYAKTTGEHYIGELYRGGIVVSVWKVNGVEHGLIASLTDLSSSAAWSDVTSTEIGATAKSPIDGQANATTIIGQAGHSSSAAKLCDDYNAGGFSDWYLPAVWELNQCYNSALVVNTILGTTNGFQLDYYWSSNESYSTHAMYQNFRYGTAYETIKSTTYRVRAVRRF